MNPSNFSKVRAELRSFINGENPTITAEIELVADGIPETDIVAAIVAKMKNQLVAAVAARIKNQ